MRLTEIFPLNWLFASKNATIDSRLIWFASVIVAESCSFCSVNLHRLFGGVHDGRPVDGATQLLFALERMNYYGDAQDSCLTAGSLSAVVNGHAEALCETIQHMREQFELDYCTWLSQQ